MSVSLIDGHIDNDAPRMTDEQIIKGWELLEKHGGTPTNFLVDETLNLINRQKAEIEKCENIIRLADKTIEKQSEKIERLESAIENLELDLEDGCEYE